MGIKIKTLFILLLIFSFLRSETRIVTVDECISIGLQNNPELNMSAEDQKIAAAKLDQLKSQKKPLLSFDARTTYDEIDTDEEKSEDHKGRLLKFYKLDEYKYGLFAGVTAKYRLIHPDYSSKLDYAKKNVEIAKLLEFQKKSEIILNIKKAYYDYLSSKHAAELMGKMEENYKKRVNVVRVLVKNGERPVIELSTAEANLSRETLNCKKAKNAQEYKRLELLASMGIFENIEGDFDFADIEKIPDFKLNIDVLLDLAENNSPSYLMAKYKKESARLSVDVAKSADNLTVDMMASFGKKDDMLYKVKYFRDNLKSKKWETVYFINFVASKPLYTGGLYTAAVEESVAAYNKERYNELQVKNSIRTTITLVYSKMQELTEQVQISKLNLENARMNLRLAQLSYDNGTGSQTTLQNAEYSLFKSELDISNSKYEYIKNLALLSNLIGVKEELLCGK